MRLIWTIFQCILRRMHCNKLTWGIIIELKSILLQILHSVPTTNHPQKRKDKTSHFYPEFVPECLLAASCRPAFSSSRVAGSWAAANPIITSSCVLKLLAKTFFTSSCRWGDRLFIDFTFSRNKCSSCDVIIPCKRFDRRPFSMLDAMARPMAPPRKRIWTTVPVAMAAMKSDGTVSQCNHLCIRKFLGGTHTQVSVLDYIWRG